MHLNLAGESTFFVVRSEGKELLFKFKQINTYEANQWPGERKEVRGKMLDVPLAGGRRRLQARAK
jgi:hypothetical protein